MNNEGKWLQTVFFVSVGGWIGTKLYKAIKARSNFDQDALQKIQFSATPTLLLHGSNGTRRSLGGMIARWAKKGQAEKVLDIKVTAEGQLTVTGNMQEIQKEKKPLIHVVFENNNAEEWEQADWLKKIMKMLRESFGVTKINLVGHSIGGVAGLRYLMEYGRYQYLPRIQKFVAIGAPFNGEVVDASGVTPYDLGEKGPQNHHESYRYFQTFREKIPTYVQMLNIIGDVNNGSRSDGFVSVDSAQSLKYLVGEQVMEYKEKKITGWMAQHSLLHENPKVDRLVANYLWGTKK